MSKGIIQHETTCNKQWIEHTLKQCEGFRTTPVFSSGKTLPFANGQDYKDISNFDKCEHIGLILDNHILLDYDGNKGDVMTVDELAEVLGEDFGMPPVAQSNDEGNSLHWLYKCDVEGLSASNDGWREHIDIKHGNQLMHIKMGKVLTLPGEDIDIAPDILIEALTSSGKEVEKTDIDVEAESWGIEPVKHSKLKPETIASMLAVLDNGVSNSEWVKIGRALFDWDNAEGLAMWESWSVGADNYDEGACEKRWESGFDNSEITVGTLVWLAREAGWSEQDNDLLMDRLIYLKTDDKYFDKTDHCLITETTMKKVMISEGFVTARGAGTASTVFHNSDRASECTVVGEFWKPCARSDEHNYIVEVDGNKYLNSWQGVKCTPVEGDVDLWLELAEFLFKDEKERDIVIKWLAAIVRYPDVKPNWQIVHRGQHRNGKDSFYKPIVTMFGSGASEVTIDELEQPFNGYLAGKRFLVFQEIWKPGSKEFANRIKPLAADTAGGRMWINAKHVKQREQQNVLGFVAMSNHRDCIAVDETEGRYFVVDSYHNPKEKEFYTRYHKWLANENGTGKIMAYLEGLNLDDFDLRILPYETEGLRDLKGHSHPEYAIAIMEAIEGNSYPFDERFVEIGGIKKWLKNEGYNRHSDKGISSALLTAKMERRRGLKKVSGKGCRTAWVWTGDKEILNMKSVELYNFINRIDDFDNLD